MKSTLAAATCAVILLAGCNNDPGTQATTAEEAGQTADAPPAAETTAVAARASPVALGLSEGQLLGAGLIGIDGVELGEVTSLLRTPEGRVDRLLVEIEDSDPDRFVEVPVQGLAILTRGRNIDLVSALTAEQLAGLPEGTPSAAN